MQQFEQPISAKLRFRLLIQTIFTFITLLLAAALIIVLCLESFTGVASSAPFVLGTCTITYYSNKYGTITNMLTINFFMAIVSLIIQIVICILVFPPLISRTQPNEKRTVFIYILNSLHMLWIINCFGKFCIFRQDLRYVSQLASCSITYSEVLVNIVMAVSAADMFFSLLQFFATLATSLGLKQQLKEAEKDMYKVMNNLTNNTIQSIQDHPRRGDSLIRSNFNQLPTQTISSKKLDLIKNEAQRYDSNIQLNSRANQSNHNYSFKNQRQLILQKKDSFPVKPSKKPNSISDEESFHSMMKEQKLALGKIANRPGPIVSGNVVQQSQQVYRSQGYLSYIRKMNAVQGTSNDTQGDLIAVIRGKYAK